MKTETKEKGGLEKSNNNSIFKPWVPWVNKITNQQFKKKKRICDEILKKKCLFK